MNTTAEPVVVDDPGTPAGTPGPNASADRTFDGGGEMGALMRSFDWSKTALGPVSGWSQALKTMVGVLLRGPSAMYLTWGPQLVQLYNDAYRPIMGAKHPEVMGQAAKESWAEIWHLVEPSFAGPTPPRFQALQPSKEANGRIAVDVPSPRLELHLVHDRPLYVQRPATAESRPPHAPAPDTAPPSCEPSPTTLAYSLRRPTLRRQLRVARAGGAVQKARAVAAIALLVADEQQVQRLADFSMRDPLPFAGSVLRVPPARRRQ